MSIKIYVAGKIASGKSTLAKQIMRHTGFPQISFGNTLKEYSQEQNLPQSREMLQSLGQDVLDEYGYSGFLKWIIDHSSSTDWNGPLIIDGFRHPLIYESALKVFPKSILLYCECDEATQIDRILVRDALTLEDIKKIISHKTEIYVSELKPYAHIVCQPESEIENTLRELDKLISDFSH